MLIGLLPKTVLDYVWHDAVINFDEFRSVVYASAVVTVVPVYQCEIESCFVAGKPVIPGMKFQLLDPLVDIRRESSIESAVRGEPEQIVVWV